VIDPASAFIEGVRFGLITFLVVAALILSVRR